MLELFQTIFGNDLQNWFYALSIFWMIAIPVYKGWKKFLMHKCDK